jgi:PKD repeat protein
MALQGISRLREQASRAQPGVISKIAVAVSLALPLSAVVVLSGGASADRLPLTGGGAWLASPALGLVTLIDGPSERVVGSVRAAGTTNGDDLAVIQSGSSAYAVNATHGSVSFIDGGTYAQTAPVGFTRPGTRPQVWPAATPNAAQELFVIDTDRSLANKVQAETLAVAEQVSLSGRPGEHQSLVDDAGRLWVIDGTRGGITSILGHKKSVNHDSVAAADTLVLVKGRAVAIDEAGQRLGPVDPDGTVHWSCLATSNDPDVQFVGSMTTDQVFAASPAAGTVAVADLDDGRCSDAIKVTQPGADLGPVTQQGHFLFVPDRSTGTAVVVDLQSGRVVAKLPVAKAGAPLELISHNSYVFYNDLGSDLAGVLKLDGAGRWRISESLHKYLSGHEGDLLESSKDGKLSDAIAAADSADADGPADDDPPKTEPTPPPSDVRPPNGAPSNRAPRTAAPPPQQDPNRPRVTAPGNRPPSTVTAPPNTTPPTTTSPPPTTTTGPPLIAVCCVRTKQTEFFAGETVSFLGTEDLAGDAATWKWSVTSSTGGPGLSPTRGEWGAYFHHTFTEAGTYTVTLTVTYQGQTDSDSMTITVMPSLDTDPPRFLPPVDSFDVMNGKADGVVVDYHLPKVEDDVDPDPKVTCTPKPGSKFPLGATKVTCTATDAAGNSATKSFTITVFRERDTTPPTVTLTVSSTSVDAGGSVTFTATADDPDSPITQISITGSVSFGCQGPETAISGISTIDPVVDNDSRVTYTWNPPANPCLLSGEEGYRTGTATMTATATSEGGEGTSAEVESTIRKP